MSTLSHTIAANKYLEAAAVRCKVAPRHAGRVRNKALRADLEDIHAEIELAKPDWKRTWEESHFAVSRY